MNVSGITWQGEKISDEEIFCELPPSLRSLLSNRNGFILYEGALHVRGASVDPDWHSLRIALRGPNAFHSLYASVLESDVPFAQDQLGDQFLLRDGKVLRLLGESGEVEPLADNLEDFFARVDEDIEGFLNIGLSHTMQPGQLLLACPPFVLQASGARACLKPIRAGDVIQFHADLARQLRDVPDGGEVQFKIVD